MKGFKNIQLKLKVDPITIKEPYNPEVKEFTDTEDFTRYFRTNEELFKEPSSSIGAAGKASSDPDKPAKFLTTNKLNRTYKIPGYRIRIIRKCTDNEELTLVKDYYKRISEDVVNEDTVNEESNNEKIVELEQSIADILERLNNIESFLVQFKR